MSKNITYDESFLDTNLQYEDIVCNTRTDERFIVNNISPEYEEAVLKIIGTNSLLTISLTDCEEFEIITDEW